MNKLFQVLCLILGLVLLLCACGNTVSQKDPSSASSVMSPDTQKDLASSPSPSIQPERPDSSLSIEAPRIPVSDTAWMLDLSYFQEQNLTLDSVYPCKNGNVLFFFSPISSDGTLQENILVYCYQTKPGKFSFEHFNAGLVGFYPSALYQDGTVSIVTLDSETYDYDSILFIHPDTLERDSIPVSWDGTVMDVSISPDKKYIAVTSYDGLSIYNYSGTQLNRIPRKAGTAPDGESDLLPYGGAWAPDSSALAVRYVGWEQVYYPALLSTHSWMLTEYPKLSNTILSFLPDATAVYSTWYSFLPCGFFEPTSGTQTPITFKDPRLASAELADMTFSSDGMLAAATLPNQDGTCTAIAAWIGSGITASELTLKLPEGDNRFFEQAAFVPDTHQLLLVTSTTDRDTRQVYVVDVPS